MENTSGGGTPGMTEIRLSGRLVCTTDAEARVVALHLREHIERTVAEPGCVSFSVTPTDDPWVWSVEERFEDQRAFALHQDRVTSSAWGRATAGIERHYRIQGLPQ